MRLLCPSTEKKDKILPAHNQIDTGNLLSNVLTFWHRDIRFFARQSEEYSNEAHLSAVKAAIQYSEENS